ncbi:MAG TPA: biopolymer transporter ExbD [Dongiaceae bacterium]|nr:biopolymer transporter ExbD [Dongiaceae bacterium]
MRRFSQRTHLVTLSEINITPLLDLAFVLLIIFVITTPLLEKGLELHLPTASNAPQDKPIRKEDVRVVEITPNGAYALDRRVLPLPQLIQQLVTAYKANPNLVVYIRADEDSRIRDLVALTDGCVGGGISRYSLRAQPPEHK